MRALTRQGILLRPIVLGWRHNIHRKFQSPSLLWRDIVVIIFSCFLVYALYSGTIDMLDKLHRVVPHTISPELPLIGILLILHILLFLASCVSALSALFLAKDLELLLSSPLPIGTFLFGKTLQIFLGSSWMTLVFGLPVIAAFARGYRVPLEFYPLATVVLIPYLFFPTFLAIALVSLLARVIPVNRTRELMLAGSALIFLGIYAAFKYALDHGRLLKHPSEFKAYFNAANLPLLEYLPSSWTAESLSLLLLQREGTQYWYLAGLLMGTALVTAIFAYLALRFFHQAAYSRAKSAGGRIQLHSRTSQRLLRWALPFLPSYARALFAKEFKIFARDIGQTVQLLLLLGLCLIYLYNFQVLRGIKGIPLSIRAWWEALLIMSNMAMGSLVITAIATRFVFPSVSLEGSAYWILASAPVRLRSILRVKFWSWYFPIAAIATVVFTSGAWAITESTAIIVSCIFMGWIISYGVVGLAIALGALFANFNWEHPSQLSASFGSFVYMVTSGLLIGFCLLPCAGIVALFTLQGLYESAQLVGIAAGSGLLFFLALLNYTAVEYAFSVGELTLKRG